MKLQGKNADLAVPTTGKNLRQPWELSPQAGEGALGTHAGPPLDLLRGLDHAGKSSRSPSLLAMAVLDFSGAAHMQCCNFCLKRLRLQISLTAWKSVKGCLHKPDVSKEINSLNLQIPFLNIGIPDRFLCNSRMCYLHQDN